MDQTYHMIETCGIPSCETWLVFAIYRRGSDALASSAIEAEAVYVDADAADLRNDVGHPAAESRRPCE